MLVGERLGDGVGLPRTKVGDAVGHLVGAEVGLAVGAEVGLPCLKVGACVGFLVGDAPL